ncbi:hypothetical protein FRX31_010889 [Thalictrum thalictroides]|uniref:Uncharacterized protein n=1 Tax=Thalictrum thalictroides TaxID=46969 RepID=A0A7J6WQ84_THATH|nr:hypothetical protein FRX31_010889 [Thalictrum thalictroides]
MASWEEDENEICNDDGFIYKRRKRQEEVVSTLLKAPVTAVVVDLEAGLKQRKKRTIAKLKDRYKKEILQWELLSNTLRELEQRTQQHQQQASSFRDETTDSSSHNQLIEPRLQSQLDHHLSQVIN